MSSWLSHFPFPFTRSRAARSHGAAPTATPTTTSPSAPVRRSARANAAAVAPAGETISVGDVLSRQVTLQWSEAVAVVGELCATMTRAGGDDHPRPSPTDILITPEGTLHLRKGRDAGEHAKLGRLLHQLLATAATPAPLRLFVSHAISSERYDTLDAFAQGLAYYEVPDRAPLIQAVYERTFSAPPAVTAPEDDPPIVEELPAPVAATPRRSRRVPLWAVAAIVMLAVAASAGAWFMAPGATGSSAELVALAAKAGDAVRAVGAGIRDTLSLGASATAAAPPKEEAPAAKPRVRRRSASAVASVAPEITAGDPAAEAPIVPVEAIIANESALVRNLAPSMTDAASTTPMLEATAEPIVDTITYSSEWPTVEPPVFLTPQLSEEPDSPSGLAAAAGVVELLINEQGAVERVKLISRPSQIQAAMLLSAAKMWQFQPALNDGRPVKYRLRVAVPVTQP